MFHLSPAPGKCALPPPELPPAVPTSELAPASLLQGKGYTIDPVTRTDGFMGLFQLHTRYGTYQCVGREMLYLRIYELRALEKMDQGMKTKAFGDALGAAAVEPVTDVVKIARNPVRSVAHMPVGVGHLFMEIGGGFAGAGGALFHIGRHDPSPQPPPSREGMAGYNVARNQWARRFAVDPYTTNRPLELKLNHLGMISFGTDKVAGAAVGFGIGSFGTLADWLSYLPDVDDHLMTAPPPEVAAVDTRRMEKLGIPKTAMKPLLDNPWFTPTLQIRYVNDLAKLRNVTDLPAAVRLAGKAQSEEQTRFLCGGLEMLDRYQKTIGPLREFQAFQGVPAAIAGDGALVVAAPIDLLSWTHIAESFAAHRDPHRPAWLYVAGPLTPRAQQGFAELGWKVCDLPPSGHR
ncbi:MAG TPA: hypothetical protein VHY22_05050 [Chthoniobacteraceae bacterium]|nr:hypothetical protein [Chthoniobacteraceae bacterium]